MKIVSRSQSTFWNQEVKCVELQNHNYDVIVSQCSGKILHVGCTDYPLENLGSLHNILIRLGIDVDGYDVDTAGIAKFRELLPDRVFFDDVSKIKGHYDLIIIPEVIEHVTNHNKFFEDLDSLDFDRFLITVPSLMGANQEFSHDNESQIFKESIHPDHKFWFSPYTICNLVETCTKWEITDAYLLHKKAQIMLMGRKDSDEIIAK